MQTVAVADARTDASTDLVCEVGIARGQTRTQSHNASDTVT